MKRLAFVNNSDGKESACNTGDPWVGKISWRRKWQPTPVFLPRESQGRRSLVGYSPWGCKESDTTERASQLHVKLMTNLDSILKSRDITLPTKVHLVKAMVFPVVMYGCESWTIKKAGHQRIDALNCGVGESS